MRSIERASVVGTALTGLVLLGVAGSSTVVRAHELGEASVEYGLGVTPFFVVVVLSTVVSLLGGIAVVTHRRSDRVGSPPGRWVRFLLVGLGAVALLSAALDGLAIAVGGGVVGVALAWLVRDRSVTGCGGCADATFAAIVTHRTVEGAIVAGVYAASAALGLVGLALFTIHAVAETVAVGELYAPAGQTWGVVGMVAVQVGFLLGASVVGTIGSLDSTGGAVVVSAAFGGVLLTTGGLERRERSSKHVP